MVDATAAALIRCIGRDWIAQDDVIAFMDPFVPTDVALNHAFNADLVGSGAEQARRARRRYVLARLKLWVSTGHLEATSIGGVRHLRRPAVLPSGDIGAAMAEEPGGKGLLR